MRKNLPAAFVPALFLLVRLFPDFAGIWAGVISLPALNVLAKIGMLIPFVLLEWLVPAAAAYLIWGLLRRSFRKYLCRMLGAALLAFFCLWYPLYFVNLHSFDATPAQLSAMCESLIDQLNASALRFDETENLPAKLVRFPEWMDALGISGVCSFLTGEALISPDLSDASRPFTAVHERMHLEGYAGEGAANIAAWHNCLRRGGAYADSARIWALRYGMGILRRSHASFYDACFARMNHRTLQSYRNAGGAYTPGQPNPFLQTLWNALGIGRQIQDYEILAAYLAANPAQ